MGARREGREGGPVRKEQTQQREELVAMYRGYQIYYHAKPIPDRRWDYDFVHEEYDGAPDAHDERHGNAGSIGECIDRIDEIEGGSTRWSGSKI